MQILYFSWIRERLGVSSEEHKTSAKTVDELINELRSADQRYAVVFEDLSKINVAVDQQLVYDWHHNLSGVKEIAFFPPMTGG